MSAVGGGVPLARTRGDGATAIGTLLLVRLAAAEGATRAEAASDLAPLFVQALSQAEWRRTAEREIGQLIAAGLATENRSRLAATEQGAKLAAAYLGQKAAPARPWAELRDVLLIAKSLGVNHLGAARLKALTRPDELRALIVQRAYGLAQRKNQPPAKLRAQLAVVALERAFGNKIKAGLGKGSALSAKAGRLLAAQLSKAPKDYGSDTKLIAELAAEQVGASDATPEALRAAILRSLGAKVLEAARRAPEARAPSAARPLPPPANDTTPAAHAPPQRERPDLAQFAHAVKQAALARAEGWPGSRKAYISRVWEIIRSSAPAWGLSEIEFKCMLAEAHRSGQLALANADLKDQSNIKDVQDSAVVYRNAVFHFIRVDA
jgi:hypothetical protein